MMVHRIKASRLILGAALSIGLGLSASAAAEVAFTVPAVANLRGEVQGTDHFELGGIAQECKVDRFFRELFYGQEEALEFKPIHERCFEKALDGLKTKFVLGGCSYPLHDFRRIGNRNRWKAKVNLKCPGEFWLEWNVYENEQKYTEGDLLCVTRMPPQREIGTAELRNAGGSPSKVAIRWDLRGIGYRVYGSRLICGPTHGEASYRGEALVSAERFDNLAPIDFSMSEGP